ncbi:serine protease [Sphaerisporangium krabiense]|uniref:Subtilisin family serine protease n=1 Tax=Sphaerisporangium krabiense TaxID=763782 RepID=A0A7W8Z3P5_9ACTN|nr:S8 family peptidase [Sphaerisporangium krabiense]MBB5626807.1 subtilisin family serine protease [Sphaerisporangium krabiense]GII67395.1 serine protease [Sphaerisporangium krabiense]
MRDHPSWRHGALAGLLAAGTALLGLGSTPAQAAQDPIRNANRPGSVPGAYIVVLKDTTALAEVTTAKAKDLTARHGGRLTYVYTAGLRGFAVKMSEQAAARLAAEPGVAYVEQDGRAHIADTQTNPPSWGLDRVDQRALPVDKGYTYGNKAENVTAYILDTGLYKAHGDFGGRASDGYDFIDDDAIANDCHGHGTHVSGTVGSATYGVAKGVRLVGVRVLDCSGNGEWSQVIAGIDWMVKNVRKPAVANMSLSGDPDSSVDDAVARATSAGITMAVAGGNNNGADSCSYSPARAPSAITAGATDSSDTRSSFSNVGTCLDVFAPGSSIVSTANSGGTATMSGTSMASPHVAGAAALYLSANPSATPAEVTKALTGNATPNVVKSPGSGSPNKLLYTGFIGGGGPNPPTCAGGGNDADVAIPDAGSAVNSPVTIQNCEGKGTTSTSVKVDVVHSFTSDLAIDLVGPSGAVFTLKKPGGVGTADGVHQTYTVNTSAENRNGAWQLRVRDLYSYDAGTIDAWSITF